MNGSIDRFVIVYQFVGILIRLLPTHNIVHQLLKVQMYQNILRFWLNVVVWSCLKFLQFDLFQNAHRTELVLAIASNVCIQTQFLVVGR